MKKVLSVLLVMVLLISSMSGLIRLGASAEVTGNLLTNGDFETPTGYNQDITNRFPSPYYASPAWSTNADFHKWFRASGGNTTIYSNIITDPANSNNKIGRVMQSALQGVTVGAGKTYELTFSAKADYAFKQLNVSFGDMANAGTNSVTPTLYPISAVTGATKTYTNSGTPVVENIFPFNSSAGCVTIAAETDKWATYKMLITLDTPLTASQLCAIRFVAGDYNSTAGQPANAPFYLDNVSLVEMAMINSSVEVVAGKAGGSLETPKSIGCAVGQTVTIKAVPFSGNTFVGWYLNNALVSTNAEYTFTATGSGNYVAKFSMDAPVYIQRDLLIPDIAGQYKTQGRTSIINKQLYLDYTASSFEFNATCKGDVKLNVSVSALNLAAGWSGLYFTVIVDGARKDRNDFHITAEGDATLTLASGLSEGPHTFQIFRQSEIPFGVFSIKSITMSGELTAKPADKNLFIEFIGDSITCGYGNLTTSATAITTPNCAQYQDGTKTYAFLTAQNLNADMSAVSNSGIGAYIGFNSYDMPVVYPCTRYARDTVTQWSFAKQPNIVVINLGTNDMGNYLTKGKTLADVKAGFASFLALVRSKNPTAPIIWAHGMMVTSADTLIKEVITEAGGAANKYYETSLYKDNAGGGSHPSEYGHQKAADDLTAFINQTFFSSTVTFDAQGGSTVASQTITTGQTLSAPANPTKSGFTFDGWYTAASDGTKVTFPYTVTANVTLYAHWMVSNAHTPGDINGDKNVDLLDVTVLSRYVAGWQGLSLVQEALDVNADGKVDLLDVTLLSRSVAGWNVTLN